MFAFRPVAAILAGCFVVHVFAGCQTAPGRLVIWLRESPGTSSLEEGQPAAQADATEYKAVEEYSLAHNTSDAGGSAVPAFGDDSGKSSPGTVPPKVRGLFGKSKRSSDGNTASLQGNAANGAVSEPVEAQQRLVPEPDRKPGFWERIGNGFRSVSDLARGRRPVKALVVLPFRPNGKKTDKEADAASSDKPIQIPAFTLQPPESIAQATALDDSLDAPASDLVSHWSEYPSPDADDVAKSQSDAIFPPLQSPQATAAP